MYKRQIKAGLNYAMSLHAIVTAHANGFDENMYLDSATRTKVEETGGANFIFVTKDNKIVTPHSDTILPSITRRSIMYVAEHYLGLEVEERDVYFDEVKDFAECGLCYRYFRLDFKSASYPPYPNSFGRRA